MRFLRDQKNNNLGFWKDIWAISVTIKIPRRLYPTFLKGSTETYPGLFKGQKRYIRGFPEHQYSYIRWFLQGKQSNNREFFKNGQLFISFFYFKNQQWTIRKVSEVSYPWSLFKDRLNCFRGFLKGQQSFIRRFLKGLLSFIRRLFVVAKWSDVIPLLLFL